MCQDERTTFRNVSGATGSAAPHSDLSWIRLTMLLRLWSKLHTYGLVRDSCRLQQDMEYARTIWRLRDRHVKDAGREIQHMQKALTKMNIQLANVISDISGTSGQAIIAAVLKGERDPYKLADLADYRVKASREEVARSLEGNWRPEVLFELQQAVDSYRFAHRQIQHPRPRRRREKRRGSHGTTNQRWT